MLLDLLNDRYLGFEAYESEKLLTVINDWPSSSFRVECPADARTHNVDRIVAELLTRGILCAEPRGREPPADSVVSVSGELACIGEEFDAWARIRIGHINAFLRAFAYSSISLRCRNLRAVVNSVRNGSAKHRAKEATVHVDEIARLVHVFRRLRAYVFSANGRCLIHALTLVNFLRLYGVHATWVIGVKTDPWAAHSWAQFGSYLLDTTPERVCSFTPILAVKA